MARGSAVGRAMTHRGSVVLHAFALLAAILSGCTNPTSSPAPDARAAGGPLREDVQALEHTVAERVERVERVEAEEALAPAGELAVHFLDVGQGDATLLVTSDTAVLVDAGRHDRGDLPEHLRRHGVERLDLVAITHPHADHLGQLAEVLDAVGVAEVWWSGATHTTQAFERALSAVEASDAAYAEPRAGDHATIGGLRFDVVNPTGLSGDLHDSSLALRVTYGDSSVLFTGDAEAHTEQSMLARHPDRLAADVYQVGHHGSTTSTTPAFLAAVSPQVAVYSAGRGNIYGHPSAEVIDRLRAAGVQVYGTDVHGTVTLTTAGDGVWTSRTGDQPVDGPETAVDEPGIEAPASPEPRGSMAVGFAAVRSPVPPRGSADATVTTAPGAECDITVTYKSGPSRAQGLTPKVAEADGTVSWTWMVGSNTTLGEWPIDVTCTADGQTASAQITFEVGR